MTIDIHFSYHFELRIDLSWLDALFSRKNYEIVNILSLFNDAYKHACSKEIIPRVKEKPNGLF